jgi:hypothetical protein
VEPAPAECVTVCLRVWCVSRIIRSEFVTVGYRLWLLGMKSRLTRAVEEVVKAVGELSRPKSIPTKRPYEAIPRFRVM